MSPLSGPARRLVRAARGSLVLTLAFMIGSTAPAGPASAATPKKLDLSAYAKLGAWVDLYEYSSLNAWDATGAMKAHGVRTLFIQTGRWNKPSPANTAEFSDRKTIDSWIHAAHARGLKIVGWYLPAYDDMARDVRRTTLIWTYRSPKEQHFDGVAIDIEYKARVKSHSAWNDAVADHFRRVRRALGARVPIAAITPAPLGMAVAPKHWAGFPWKALADQADVFMPMGYWSYRKDCSKNASHCPYGYTKGNISETRRLTGKPHVLVHAIGGVTDNIDARSVQDFVRAVRELKSFGGSIYDYHTTTAAMWKPLAALTK